MLHRAPQSAFWVPLPSHLGHSQQHAATDAGEGSSIVPLQQSVSKSSSALVQLMSTSDSDAQRATPTWNSESGASRSEARPLDGENPTDSAPNSETALLKPHSSHTTDKTHYANQSAPAFATPGGEALEDISSLRSNYPCTNGAHHGMHHQVPLTTIDRHETRSALSIGAAFGLPLEVPRSEMDERMTAFLLTFVVNASEHKCRGEEAA